MKTLSQWIVLISLILTAICCGGDKAGVEALDYAAYKKKCIQHLNSLNESHSRLWNLGNSKRWDADQEKGILRWTFDDGTMVEAPFQIIGTYNEKDGTFLWGWDHPSVLPPLRTHAALLKTFGETYGIKNLTTQKVACTQQEAWEFTALGVTKANAQGAYKGLSGTVHVFMTFGEVTIEKKPGSRSPNKNGELNSR